MSELLTAQLFVSVHVLLIVIHILLLTFAYLVYVERKVCAYIQDRIGPNRVGPIGLLQPIADGFKFFLKEDYTPARVDKVLFSMAPLIVVSSALIGWVIIPWGGYWDMPGLTLPLLGTIEGGRVLVAGANVNIGVVFLLAVGSLGVYGVTIGGWASNNKYSFLGGLRASAGMISYEIPMGLALLAVLLMAGSVEPQRIVELQAQHGWFVLSQPIAAVLFLVSILAEANRAPFDNAEAEQELIGGYHTEYTSMRLALFFMGEYLHLLTTCAFLVLLFFGGYHLPFIGLTSPEATGLLAVLVKFGVLFTKVVFTLTLTIILRWTVPRIRWDQVMKLAWNDLIPIGIAVLVMSAVMVHLGRTSWPWMLLMNVGLAGVILLIQPFLPKRELNKRVPLAGSRFCPLPGEPVVSAPSRAVAFDDGAALSDRKQETVGAS